MNVLITGSNTGLGFGLTNYYLGIRNNLYGISREMNSELNSHSNHNSLIRDIFSKNWKN